MPESAREPWDHGSPEQVDDIPPEMMHAANAIVARERGIAAPDPIETLIDRCTRID